MRCVLGRRAEEIGIYWVSAFGEWSVIRPDRVRSSRLSTCSFLYYLNYIIRRFRGLVLAMYLSSVCS
jgi:hypothetical protein